MVQVTQMDKNNSGLRDPCVRFVCHTTVRANDKRLLQNLVKHATTHNRVIEEEHCWREILHRRKEEKERKRSKHHHTRDSLPAPTQQALDAYERKLRLEAKRQLEELASCRIPYGDGQKLLDRWGHDGWEDLNKPGPPHLSESFTKSSRPPEAPAPRLPMPRVVYTEPGSPEPEPVTKPREKKRRHKKEKSKKSLKRPKGRKRSSTPDLSRDSSMSSLRSDEEIEWQEKK
ncbi:hypothetical protein CRM22_009224 [Opisthorchis felineus]|uniref:Uncharacterized protein n=1 Tax=Opisthorchis felineus TaxID=147828 RepID=A0A4S2L8K5_OPIFE|nr:hypothetical protein CRM22_009224 [Opisthorchis felineus]